MVIETYAYNFLTWGISGMKTCSKIKSMQTLVNFPVFVAANLRFSINRYHLISWVTYTMKCKMNIRGIGSNSTKHANQEILVKIFWSLFQKVYCFSAQYCVLHSASKFSLILMCSFISCDKTPELFYNFLVASIAYVQTRYLSQFIRYIRVCTYLWYFI